MLGQAANIFSTVSEHRTLYIRSQIDAMKKKEANNSTRFTAQGNTAY